MSNSISGNSTVLFGPEPNPGDNIGGYKLLKKLGQGGMGHVWKVEHLATGTLYAMKLLPPVLAADPRAWSETLKNFQLVSKLNHQHICPLHVLDRDPKHGPYLVMALIDGVSLDEYRDARGTFTAVEVATLLRPVAEALDYAQSQGVIHRDVKHDNIVLQTPDGGKTITGTFVIDFGLAAQVRSSISNYSQHDVSLAGTIRYMAPETWRGRPAVPQTDQYALAVIAYRLLAGYYPFDCPDRSIMRDAVLNEEIEQIVGQSRSTFQVLQKGMAKERSGRYQSCLDLVTALQGRQHSAGSDDVTGITRIRIANLMNGACAGETRSFGQPSIAMCWCPAGTFGMGIQNTNVVISRGFWIGQTVITRDQWLRVNSKKVWEDQNKVFFGAQTAGNNHPATRMTHGRGVDGLIAKDSAWDFCLRLTEREVASQRLPDGWAYSIPTEAQWEYACRAGTTTKYCFGDNAHKLNDYAWFIENSFDIAYHHMKEVGKKKPNPWGIHDMHGGVFEWARDGYSEKQNSGLDPYIIGDGPLRVVRGACWNSSQEHCQSSYRHGNQFDNGVIYIGFRVVLEQVVDTDAARQSRQCT